MRDPVYWPDVDQKIWDDAFIGVLKVRLSTHVRYKLRKKWFIQEIVVNKSVDPMNKSCRSVLDIIAHAFADLCLEVHLFKEAGKKAAFPKTDDPCQENELTRLKIKYPERKIKAI